MRPWCRDGLGHSDLHVGFDVNRRAVEALPAHPDDWLIVAGDTGDTLAQLELVLDVVTARFARVFWTPGNHDLWTPRQWPEARRGKAHYDRLVEACRQRGVHTPEDPFVIWPGAVPVAIAPCFTLYDYSFAPPGLSPEAAVAWAAETGVQCADEVLLSPAPYCDARRVVRRRVWPTPRPGSPTMPSGTRIALVNHFPLRPDLAVLPRIPALHDLVRHDARPPTGTRAIRWTSSSRAICTCAARGGATASASRKCRSDIRRSGNSRRA